MLHVALVDDSPFQRELEFELIQEFLKEYPYEVEIECFTGGSALLERVSASPAGGGKIFDLFILDIIMPELSGIELADLLRKKGQTGAIVFISASADYAVQSYDVDATYYLLKPIDRDKFYRVFDRVFSGLQMNAETDKLAVDISDGMVFIEKKHLDYVCVQNRRPCYVMDDGRQLLGKVLRGKFRDAMAPLLADPHFAECGLTYVVRLNAIDTADEQGVMLRNGTMLYLSAGAARDMMRRLRK